MKTLFHTLTLFAVAVIIMLVTKETAPNVQDVSIQSVQANSNGTYSYNLFIPKEVLTHYREDCENDRPVEAYFSTEWYTANTDIDDGAEKWSEPQEMKLENGYYVADDPQDQGAKIFANSKFFSDFSSNPHIQWKIYTEDTEPQKSTRTP